MNGKRIAAGGTIADVVQDVFRYCGRSTSFVEDKKENAVKKSRIWKTMMLVGAQALLFASGGTCLPDNIFAETAGDIVNGLIIAGFNVLAAGSGLQI